MNDTVDLARLKEDLNIVFPQIQITGPLRFLGFGFSSLVLETPNGIIFRIAKNQEAAEGYKKEIQLLPFLQTRLPVAVPHPLWYISSCKQFPFGVIGYFKIRGVPLQPEFLIDKGHASLAEACAYFLLALHSIPSEEVQQLGVPEPQAFWERLERLRVDVLPTLRDLLLVHDYHQIELWWDAFLHDPDLRQITPCLCHGDLWHENILVDTTYLTITGILDFEGVVLADPAQDFAALLHLGKPFVTSVINAYRLQSDRLSENIAYRIERYWELRDFGGLQLSVKYDDQKELIDSLRKLQHGPILDPEMRFLREVS